MSDLVDEYDGVVATDHARRASGRLSPSGLSGLKSLFRALPETADGMNRKVGLAGDGHAVYRNASTDVLVFYRIRVRHNGTVRPVGGRGRRDADRHAPPGEFGDRYLITPDTDAGSGS